MPSEIPDYWVRSCTTCGIRCVQKSRKPGKGEQMYKADGLCNSCYSKREYDKPPTKLMACDECQRNMVPARNSTMGGKFVRHGGYGLCKACYRRERRRASASNDTHAGAGD